MKITQTDHKHVELYRVIQKDLNIDRSLTNTWRFFFACSMGQQYRMFPKMWEPPQNSMRQKVCH